MKFTQSQKIYSAVLGVGVCALLYDRCFSDPKALPKTVSANASVTMDRREPAMLLSNSRAFAVDGDITRRLERLKNTLPSFPQLRDAFVPSPDWIASTAPQSGSPSDKAKIFKSMHQLRAILETRGRGQVIVDNNLVVVGQSVDGFVLVSVDHLSAVFADSDSQSVLTLAPDSLSQQTQQ
jgi:hypothetical protein